MAPRNPNYGSLIENRDFESGTTQGETSPLVGFKRLQAQMGKSLKKSTRWIIVSIGLIAAVAATFHHSKKVSPLSSFGSGDEFQSPQDMGFLTVERKLAESPGKAWGSKLLKGKKPIPTNIWYLVS